MGAVYGALDEQDRCVAVKVIRPDLAGRDDYRERFAREVELLAGLDAECAPRFLGADPQAEQPWLACEFVPGRTLGAQVREHGPLGHDALLALAAGTAEALAAIHAAGIIHRDIKPGNVILSPTGPRVLDFGIARGVDEQSPEQGVYGTPGYLPPERLAGGPSSTVGDVFAWAALVVFAATGSHPFQAEGTEEVLRRVRASEADLGGVPESLRGLLAEALEADTSERPSAEECFTRVLSLAAPAVGCGQDNSRNLIPSADAQQLVVEHLHAQAILAGRHVHDRIPAVVAGPRAEPGATQRYLRSSQRLIVACGDLTAHSAGRLGAEDPRARNCCQKGDGCAHPRTIRERKGVRELRRRHRRPRTGSYVCAGVAPQHLFGRATGGLQRTELRAAARRSPIPRTARSGERVGRPR
jgi:hypothetical protein